MSINLKATLEELAVTPGSKSVCLHSYHAGFFANWHSVLGLLEGCAQYGYKPTVQFTTGFYADSKHDANWWLNYFEPFPDQVSTKVPRTQERVGASSRLSQYAYQHMTLQRGAWLCHNYLSIRPRLLTDAAAFVDRWFTGRYVIGLQRRAGNIVLHKNSPPIPPDYAIEHVEQFAQQLDRPWRLFVAACEQPFVDEMMQHFGDNCVCQEDVLRAGDIQSAYYDPAYDDQGYRKGREVLMDALLLARTDYLFHTYSGVSYAVLKMNPLLALNGTDLTECRRSSHDDSELVRELQAIHKPLVREGERTYYG